MGTDDRGRDVLARLLYGFRVSVLFALALTAIGSLLGILAGAVARLFWRAHRFDFAKADRNLGSLPELYLLIIFASLFTPSLWLLLALLSLFGWMGLSICARRISAQPANGIRAGRPRAGPFQQRHHVAAHPAQQPSPFVITFLPFHLRRYPGLTSLGFPVWAYPPHPSLGELLAQGKDNLDAWWISLSTFGVAGRWCCWILLARHCGGGGYKVRMAGQGTGSLPGQTCRHNRNVLWTSPHYY